MQNQLRKQYLQELTEQANTIPISYNKRNCTDVCCIPIGILFSLTLFIIAAIVFDKNTFMITNFPADSDGNVCGYDLPAYPYVYFVNPPNKGKRVCVAKCPSSEDKQLQCVPTKDIGCRYSSTPDFQVNFYANTAQQHYDGYYCFPNDEELKQQLKQNTHLNNRANIIDSLRSLFISLLISLAIGLIFFLFVQFFPQVMNYVAIIGGVIFSLIVLLLVALYQTSHTVAKWITFALMVLLFFTIVITILRNYSNLKIYGIYLRYATQCVKERLFVVIYIPIFLIITAAFLFIMAMQFQSFWTMGSTSFDGQISLFHTVRSAGSIIFFIIWVIQLIWGLSFLKESFNFLVSGLATQWYQFEEEKNINDNLENDVWYLPLKCLILKHLGSVIGGSFMTSFFLIPDMFIDSIKPKDLEQEQSQSCQKSTFSLLCYPCWKVTQLVRSDAMGYLFMAGNPFCNSSRYCEYLANKSYKSISKQHPEATQLISRAYRICAHALCSIIVMIISFYIEGQMYLSLALFLLFLANYSVTFFICLHSDIAQAIVVLVLIHEQFQTRKDMKISLLQGQQKLKSILVKDSKRKDLKSQIYKSRIEQIQKLKASKIQVPQNDKN